MLKIRKKLPHKKKKPGKKRPGGYRRLLRYAIRTAFAIFGAQVLVVVLAGLFNFPTNFYMLRETLRLDGIKQNWVALEQISEHVPRAVVAAEDANFCLHWGFDLAAIRRVVEGGGEQFRGASSLTQQVAKNTFLWPERSWFRKALEAEFTLLIEALWPKKRILEVYVNIAEFDEGVFGVEAAARHYFDRPASKLTLHQSARLAAILPSPKTRSASRPTAFVKNRTSAIIDGARTIQSDGRDECFSKVENASATGQ